MSNLDVLSMAIKNLFKRKLRTSLTVFGVIIGVVSIVLMISLGIGVNMSFEKQMEQMGDLTIVNLYAYSGYRGEAGAPVFDDDMIEQISHIKGVELVTPVVETSLSLVSGKYTTDYQISIMGLAEGALEALGYELYDGEYTKNSDQFEIVFGSDAPDLFKTDIERRKNSAGSAGSGYSNFIYMGFGEEKGDVIEYKFDMFNERIDGSYDYNFGDKNVEYEEGKKPDVYRIKCVGVLKRNESNLETSYYSFMDIDKVQKIIADQEKFNQSGGYRDFGRNRKTFGYQRGYIKCSDVDMVVPVVKELKDMGFDVGTQMERIGELKGILASLQALLAAIGAVSLFVAAIGIANTMIMAIYERTKEIGIMKVIGAAIRDIKKLFLTEAALIGIMGGVLGVILSYIGSYIINNVGISFLSELTSSMMYYGRSDESVSVSYIPPWLSLAALVFATIIGLLSGYFPARRAMKLSALSAIKAE